MTVGILAVQGDFLEHRLAVERCGQKSVEIRQPQDITPDFDRLILPGGESTTQAKLLHETGLFAVLKQKIEGGMPVLATCAGLILLAAEVEGTTTNQYPGFGTLPCQVLRNAYGRQLGSFHQLGRYLPRTGETGQHADQVAKPANASATVQVAGKGLAVPMTFIRAPRIIEIGHCQPAAYLPQADADPVSGDSANGQVAHGSPGEVVGVRFQNQIALAFHPELDHNLTIMEEFLQL